MLDDELGLAPVGEPRNVLDIGTGTGMWAKDYAEKHPTSNVIGIDISLIQYPRNTPPNCRFEHEDTEDKWIHEEPFDYVHLRTMCIAFHHPEAIPGLVFDYLKPGRWIEYQDIGWEVVAADEASEMATQNDPTSARQWFRRIAEGNQVLKNPDPRVTTKYKQWLIDAGFVDFKAQQILVPLNSWPLDPKDQEIGSYMAKDIVEAIESTSRLIRASGFETDRESREWATGAQSWVKDTNNHAYLLWYVVYSQKPTV